MQIAPEVLLLISLITLLLFALYMRATMKHEVTKRKVITLERDIKELYCGYKRLRQRIS